MLGLTLFGPPALRRDGVPIALPIKKSMALLLLLARHAAPLPRGRIAALLWPDLEQANARRNLRRELARLRESGAGDAVAVGGDYLGLDAAVEVDVARFEAALDAGRADDALALWRGTPADGFALGDADAFDDWLERERRQLNERRRRALQASAAAHEANGEWQAALDRIETLLADDPLQEQHHRDAMRLLAVTGRREAALARFERCRTTLRDELGLAPMAETEALAAALRGDVGAKRAGASSTATDASARLGANAPAVPARRADARPAPLPEQLPFVGRDREAELLEAAWASDRPIVIEGDGGLGKTRLATDFAAAHGPYALARCRAGDADVPYASFARALRALMGPTPALPGLPDWIVAEVARLVPELGAASAPLRTDDERNRFFEACARAWQALSAEDFDAVIVDDWHLADAASRTLFGFVMRRRHESGRGGARELVVLRPELDADARDGLRGLVASTDALRLPLAALSGADVFELVRRLSGAGDPSRFAGRLARATGGNAFFLAETLRHLMESGLLTVDSEGAWQTPFDASTEDYREMPVAASVQEAVLARAHRLPSSAGRVLEAAALAAEPFSPRLLAPACALSELDTVLAIESAVGAGLLQEHPAGGFAFAHDLVQQAIAGGLSEQRRRLVHRRLALGASAAGAPPATIALHHEASGDAARAVEHRLAAGDEARRLRALPEAMAHWQRALTDGPTPGQAVALHERLCKLAYERTDSGAVHAQADALGRLLDAGELTADERLAATIARGLALARGGRGSEALAVLDALPIEPRGGARLDALWARALALFEVGRIEEAGAAIDAALALPELADAQRIELLDFAFMSDYNAGDHDAALVRTDAALLLARRLGDGAGLARGRLRRGIVLLATDDTAGAVSELLAAADDAGRLGLVRLARMALYNLTCAYASQGGHRQALAAAERGWNLEPPLEASDFRVMYRLALVDAWFALGDLGACWREALAAVEEALAEGDPRVRIGAITCTLEPLGMLGEAALARRLIASVGGDDARELKAAADEMWIARAQFELRHGDPAAAVAALGELDASGEAAIARVRMRALQARAELALVRDDAATALAWLPADDLPGMNGEMRTRGLALRIQAEARSGRLGDGTANAAQAALAAAADHAIATLELRTALAQAREAGVAGVAAAASEELAACVAELAETLRGHPSQRAAFEAAWQARSTRPALTGSP